MGTGDIWKYDIASDQWSKIEGIYLKVHAATAMLSVDENYVIIAGGVQWTEEQYIEKLNAIHILDETEFKLKKSTIVTPWRGSDMSMTITGGGLLDEKLVIGWIRKLFGSATFAD